MSDEEFMRAVWCMLAAVGVVLAVRGGGFTSWASAGWALGVIGAAVLTMCVRSGAAAARARSRVVHSHNTSIRVAAKHEIGHVMAIEAAGGTVTNVIVREDGSGLTSYDEPRGGFTLEQELALDYAGGIASGTWDGCDTDLDWAKQALDALPRQERKAAERGGMSRARAVTRGGLFTSVNTRAQRLLTTGSWK